MSQTTSLKGQIITQVIAAAAFLGVPIIITLMVPFTDLEFRRARDGANVSVTRYVLMFIPWQKTEVANVRAILSEVTPEFRYANTAENRRKGRAGTISLSTGQLVIVSDGDEVIVQVAPEKAKGVSDQFKRFLGDKSATPVMIPVYASWSLSYLLGGAVSALAAFYAICAFLAVVTYPFKRQRPQS